MGALKQLQTDEDNVKAEHGLASQKGLTGYPLAKRFSPASPLMLLPSKLPIPKSSPSTKPSQVSSGEQEKGKNVISWDEESRKQQGLISDGKGHKASLLYTPGGEVKKGSLGLPLLPPIRKAGSLPVGSAAGSVQSSLQLDFQESQEMRPRPSSSSQEKSSDHAGLTGYPLAKRFSPASPLMLLPSKLPIPKSSPSTKPSQVCSGEQEKGKNVISWDEESRKPQGLISDGKGHKASLLYTPGGEVKKGSLGLPLLPPIRKAGSLPVGSAAGSVQSSLQLDFQESQEMRPRPSSSSQEKSSDHAGCSESIPKTQRTKEKSSQCKTGPGMPLFPRKLPEPLGLETHVPNRGLGNGGLGPRPAQGALAQEPQQRPPSSAGPRVTAGEDKGKAEHGSASHRGLTGYTIAKRFSLASPSPLLPSKPLPPIPERSSSIKPRKTYNEEKEKSQTSTGYTDTRRISQELSSDGISCKASLVHSTEGDLKKRSLAPPLLPPIRKAGSLPVGSAAGSVRSSLPLDFQESQEMRPRPSSSSQEKSSDHAGLPVSQAKELDHPTSPGFMSDSDLRDSSGKIRPALCKLAQKSLERKKMELLKKELERRRLNQTSLLLPPQPVEPGDAAEAIPAGFRLPPVDGTAASGQRKHPGSDLKKQVVRKQDNVPLLPSTSTIHGDGSFPRNSTVTSEMAAGAQRREQPRRGTGQKDAAFAAPQQSLQEALSLLGSDDWEKKEKGLCIIKQLAESHSEVLLCRLREICLAVTSEVTSLRSKLSCSAIVTLGELFALLRKDMDSEVDEVAPVLLHMVWNSPEFVQKAACQALGIMVEKVTPARAMTVLMDKGVKSRYAQVRKCAAELLLSLVQRIGVTKLAGTARAETLAHVAGTLAQDCHQDTRHYGQEMVKMLLNNPKLKKLLEQSLSTHDLEDILTRIKKKGMENQKAERPSVKNLAKKGSDGSKKPQATLPSSNRVESTSDGRLLHRAKVQVTLPRAVEEMKPLQKLYHLLEAKEFQIRMEGVALLLELCKTRPQLISTNITQIFDYFDLRLCDTHKRVRQKALDVLAEIIGLLEDALSPVIIRLVEGITKNLNSKDPGVRAAAVRALEGSIAHLDKVSLMKELSNQRRQLSGEALLVVTECITVLVEWVYARSPEVVERYALPVLWSFLENKALPVRSASVRTVATKLALALYEVMGTKLKKCAASKPPRVQENLSKLLGC
nr:TOG array regulator of axonemal microtubules protein 2-like isoform X4 [Taeniopygia guttata]